MIWAILRMFDDFPPFCSDVVHTSTFDMQQSPTMEIQPSSTINWELSRCLPTLGY